MFAGRTLGTHLASPPLPQHHQALSVDSIDLLSTTVAGRDRFQCSLARGSGAYISASSENIGPITQRIGISHVMNDVCIAGGFYHTAGSKPKTNLEQQRPMQRNLCSKAATRDLCSHPPCRIRNYLQPLCVLPSLHFTRRQSQYRSAVITSTKCPNLDGRRLIDWSWLMRAPNHNITTPKSRTRCLTGLTGRNRYHNVRHVEVNVTMCRYPSLGR
jgi:hypothetical protein